MPIYHLEIFPTELLRRALSSQYMSDCNLGCCPITWTHPSRWCRTDVQWDLKARGPCTLSARPGYQVQRGPVASRLPVHLMHTQPAGKL
eukprot:376362-Pyramimonas_sp.AAC.2